MFFPTTTQHYFSHRINREVKEIYWESFLANFALALVFIFEPVYLYILTHSLISILWFYVQVYAWYIALVCFGAKFAGKYGYKHSIFLSNIFYIVYWIMLYFIRDYSALFYVAPIFFAIQKSFLWPAFNADVAMFDVKKQRGREVGMLLSIQEIAFITAPFLGGLIATKIGFLTLFILASIMMLLSIIPLFRTPDIFMRHKFQFKNLWRVFKVHKQNFFGYWGYAEDLMVMSLWPVYIFIIVPVFASIGLLTAIAMLVAVVLMLYIGQSYDHSNKQFLIERNSLFYGLSWLFRGLATSIPVVLMFDVATKMLKSLVYVPVLALTFELAGSQGADYAIAYSVFFEFSLAVGKIVTALAAIWILSITGNIYIVFGFAGIMTMFYGILKK